MSVGYNYYLVHVGLPMPAVDDNENLGVERIFLETTPS